MNIPSYLHYAIFLEKIIKNIYRLLSLISTKDRILFILADGKDEKKDVAKKDERKDDHRRDDRDRRTTRHHDSRDRGHHSRYDRHRHHSSHHDSHRSPRSAHRTKSKGKIQTFDYHCCIDLDKRDIQRMFFFFLYQNIHCNLVNSH